MRGFPNGRETAKVGSFREGIEQHSLLSLAYLALVLLCHKNLPEYLKPSLSPSLNPTSGRPRTSCAGLQRVVRAYQDFKDEPGFTRVVPIEEIRAKEGNLSIPLYVGGETQEQTDAATESATTALPDALSAWLESSSAVRQSLSSLLSAK
jgi:hypothetical protein